MVKQQITSELGKTTRGGVFKLTASWASDDLSLTRGCSMMTWDVLQMFPDQVATWGTWAPLVPRLGKRCQISRSKKQKTLSFIWWFTWKSIFSHVCCLGLNSFIGFGLDFSISSLICNGWCQMTKSQFSSLEIQPEKYYLTFSASDQSMMVWLQPLSFIQTSLSDYAAKMTKSSLCDLTSRSI